MHNVSVIKAESLANCHILVGVFEGEFGRGLHLPGFGGEIKR